ncbi:MAG: GNAT family N-acetyltransferase [Sphingomonadales bacterium]
MGQIRKLVPGDEALAEAFLRGHADSSMHMLSDIRRAGLVDKGEPFQATYVALLRDGRIQSLAAHAWHGIIQLQVPVASPELLARLVAISGRPVKGLVGPLDQVDHARHWPGLGRREPFLESREHLMALDLVKLQVPRALSNGLECRLPLEDELDLVAKWRVGFRLDLLADVDSDQLFQTEQAAARRLQSDRQHWVVADDAGPVAYAGFNAALPDAVQLAWVWTPAEHRGRGFGRSVVAGALLAARETGASRGVLTANENNAPALAAYRALGFYAVGRFGFVFFEPPR